MFANVSVNIGKKKGKNKKEDGSLFRSTSLISHLGWSEETFSGVPRHGGDKDYPCPSQFLILLLVPYNF